MRRWEYPVSTAGIVTAKSLRGALEMHRTVQRIAKEQRAAPEA